MHPELQLSLALLRQACVYFSLQELLQQLVERREVGCRVLTAGGSQYTVYWLKKQHGTYVDGALSVTDPLYDSHELFGEGDEQYVVMLFGRSLMEQSWRRGGGCKNSRTQ